jgi:ATP synthase protein I
MAYRITKSAGRALRTVGAISTVGFAFVLAVVMGAGLGLLIDRWTGQRGLFFVIFFFIGVAAGILNVFRTVSRVFPDKPDDGGT